LTSGITTPVACGMVRGVAGRMIQHATPAATCPAPDRIPRETKDEGLRAVTAQTILHLMPEIALPTKDETTAQTASRTIRGRWGRQFTAGRLTPYVRSRQTERLSRTNDTNLSHWWSATWYWLQFLRACGIGHNRSLVCLLPYSLSSSSSTSSTAAEPWYEIATRWDAPSLPYGA
jgi:hypothetical protein